MSRSGRMQQKMREVVAEERLEQGVGERGARRPLGAGRRGINIYAIDELPGEHWTRAVQNTCAFARQAAWFAASCPWDPLGSPGERQP